MLIVLLTSPRVAPGLLSWKAWQALRSAAVVLAPPGHPQLPALDEAGISYQLADEPGAGPLATGDVVWLPPPGLEPPVPPDAQV
ncbi:MAG: nucleoside triphosphate pyrophosphohydrolase, partial [Actinomycetota bacterium]|nr:nucleoside triphosphate pyrophosphohydrolase [Actinomycetota bacterium]